MRIEYAIPCHEMLPQPSESLPTIVGAGANTRDFEALPRPVELTTALRVVVDRADEAVPVRCEIAAPNLLHEPQVMESEITVHRPDDLPEGWEPTALFPWPVLFTAYEYGTYTVTITVGDSARTSFPVIVRRS